MGACRTAQRDILAVGWRQGLRPCLTGKTMSVVVGIPDVADFSSQIALTKLNSRMIESHFSERNVFFIA